MILWKQHHCVCDGISAISLHLAMSDTYDITSLINIKKVSFIQRMILRLSFLIFLPKVIFNYFGRSVLINPLNDGKRELSGKKIVAYSHEFSFKEVK